jgi:3-hydroxyacyl-[acyl-carrier-protein] dehydratase
MLLNDFFTLDHWQMDKTSARAVLRLHPEHPIFGGHFAGRPVVPGACLLQLVEELMARVTGKGGRLNKADQIKFVSMIEPHLNTMVTMTLTWRETATGELRVDAEASANGSAGATAYGSAEPSTPTSVCFKFKGIFQAA